MKVRLIRAVCENDAKRVHKLIADGATIDVRDAEGYTPSMYAVASENVELLRTLISAGADVNIRDWSGWGVGEPLLHKSIYCETTTPLHMLLVAGAHVEARDVHGNTALMRALLEKKVEHALILIAVGAQTNIKNHEKKTVGMLAFDTGDCECIRAVIASMVCQPHVAHVKNIPSRKSRAHLMRKAKLKFT